MELGDFDLQSYLEWRQTVTEEQSGSEKFEGILDDRDQEEPDFEIDPEFSSTNTNYGGKDPALD